ncbi:MAG: HAD family phosphatase [Planctomycetaceae bacterium]|jgi:beta-phosphoglucomutase-like phosphatase (HAD superfamily)|nr:HAD family phosphatase [Planctomycetaceae bacterium]
MADQWPALRAVVFDLDGVLIDSEHLSDELVAGALSAWGYDISPEACGRKFLGHGVTGVRRIVLAETGRELPAEFGAELDRRVREHFPGRLAMVAGAGEAVRGLASAGLAVAVASNSGPEYMRFTLGLTGLMDAGEGPAGRGWWEGRLHSGAEVPQPKPAPDVYLKAAGGLGVAARACMAVEDTPLGVRAASGAGMRVVGFLGGSHLRGRGEWADVLREAGAGWIAESHEQVVGLARAWSAGAIATLGEK